MGQIELEELFKRKKLQTIRLLEVAETTRRMSEAMGRRDDVSVRMLLGERELPIRQLQEIEEGINEYILTLPEDEAIRYTELLRGAAPATDEEKLLTDQVMQYLRALESTVEQDKQLSVRLGGKRSFYQKFKT